MAGLLSLSNELLIHICSSSATIQPAASLSGANKRLRSVWLQHTNPILKTILSRQIPAYEDAIDFTILEESCTNNTQPTLPTTTNQIPLRHHLPRLLHNANLASSATSAFAAYIANLGPANYRTKMVFPSPHATYYLMRKVVLSRQHPEAQLHHALYSTFRALTKDTVKTLDEFSMFLLGSHADDDERLKHGISKPEEDWTEADQFNNYFKGYVDTEEWEYLCDVLDAALAEIYHGKEGTLKEVFFNGAEGSS